MTRVVDQLPKLHEASEKEQQRAGIEPAPPRECRGGFYAFHVASAPKGRLRVSIHTDAAGLLRVQCFAEHVDA